MHATAATWPQFAAGVRVSYKIAGNSAGHLPNVELPVVSQTSGGSERSRYKTKLVSWWTTTVSPNK